ncbi:hypothetical protein RNZ50_24450 [Paracoccaceae bacterium Fryx2]|nr:hypothetical protein [Paracoccaceae bacterium Fryx2]
MLASLPFEVKLIEIGIATRSQDTWLNTLLGDGIATLIADGTLDTLLQAHHLQPAEES